MIDVAALKQLVIYDPNSGALTWQERGHDLFSEERLCKVWNARFAGRPAIANRSQKGYLQGAIFGHFVKAHRVAWALMTDEWPKSAIDHIDLDKANNRWANLRLATASENARNKGLTAANRSGVKGVHWAANDRRWRAQIKHLGQKIWLGEFETIDAAAAAYAKASARLHGEFGRSK